MYLTTSTEHKTYVGVFKLITSGIIEICIDDNTNIDVEEVSHIKEMNMKLANGKKYAVLVNSGNFTTITKEARELTASKEFVKNTIAKALLVHSLAQLIIGRFYIRINKPHIKTHLFKDRDKAIEWLKKQVKKHS